MCRRDLGAREEGITIDFVMGQVEKALKGIEAEEAKKIVFAYEPIWAIGTGKTASAADAQEVIGAIRNKISELYNKEVAEAVRILYGGSVKPENIKELMAEADIDGALVGGASLKAKLLCDLFFQSIIGVEESVKKPLMLMILDGWGLN